MPKLNVAFRTALLLIAAVIAVVMVELAVEDAINAALLGGKPLDASVQKWIDIVVTALAILFVGGGAAFFQFRASRADEDLRSQGEIMEHIAEAVITSDANGRIQRWNKGAEHLFGYTSKEAIGRNTSMLLDLSWAAAKNLYGVPLLARGNLEFTTKMRRKSGDFFSGHMRASVIKGAAGEVVGMVGYTVDVTDRLQAEAELRRKEHFLAEAQRISHVGTWDWNPETKVLWWSDEVYRLFGFEPQSFPGSYQKFMEHVHPEDKPVVRGFLQSIPELRRHTSLDYRVITADGLERSIQGHAEPFYDNDGGYVGITGTVMDITDRMEAQKMLQMARDELEQRVAARTHELQTTLQTLVEGVITIDCTGRIEAFNSSAEILFGYQSDEAIGENVTLLMGGEHAAHHGTYLESYLNTGDAQIMGVGREVMGKRKDGSSFPMWLGIGEMWVAGERKFVGTVQDITERKAAEMGMIHAKEEAETANQAKSEFLSSMSHELRTPMNAVLGFAQLLDVDREHPLPEHQKSYVDEILRSGRHMVELIDRVLDLESIERGKVKLNMVNCPVTPIIEQSLSLISAEAQASGITISCQPADNDVPNVMVDQLRLRQSILNLVSNAIKYNHELGSVVVECRVDTAGIVRISVADTGFGIANDQKEKVFEPFERLGVENSNILGAGIGLSVTKQFIESMGGTVGFESEFGVGSLFWIDLPAAEAQISSFEKSSII